MAGLTGAEHKIPGEGDGFDQAAGFLIGQALQGQVQGREPGGASFFS